MSTCVTAGAVVGAFVAARLTGVVTEGALVPLCETPSPASDVTLAIVEEPGGGRGHLPIRARPTLTLSQLEVLVRHHDVEQLVQSSLSGPVHCRHVTSHRWHVSCGLKYSPADGEQHKSPP